jgi:sugar fermentation stimulation protein A
LRWSGLDVAATSGFLSAMAAAELVRARLLRRYQRFLADVELADGATCTVHCSNPGRMLGLNAPGLVCWLRPAPAGRKLPYRLELIEADGTLVGVDTSVPNRLVADAVAAGAIPQLRGYARIRREVRYGAENSRIDLLLEDDARLRCWVEVKNVHWRVGEVARFPDAVTTRGAKHLRELAAQVAIGERAVMIYVVQRGDCAAFGLARDIDPAYAGACVEAHDAGVELLAYACRVELDGTVITRELPIDLKA